MDDLPISQELKDLAQLHLTPENEPFRPPTPIAYVSPESPKKPSPYGDQGDFNYQDFMNPNNDSSESNSNTASQPDTQKNDWSWIPPVTQSDSYTVDKQDPVMRKRDDDLTKNPFFNDDKYQNIDSDEVLPFTTQMDRTWDIPGLVNV